MGLLKSAEGGDYETAARYLEPTSGRDTNLAQRAKEFLALQGRFRAHIGMLSDDPNGTVEPGLPPGQARAGEFEMGSTTTDVILVRVNDPASGKIWLISKETVASIPNLYAQMESEAPTAADRILPATLTGRQLLGMSPAQWLAWLLSIPMSWLLAWPLMFLLSAPERVHPHGPKL
jgi:MscS family membrane protein